MIDRNPRFGNNDRFNEPDRTRKNREPCDHDAVDPRLHEFAPLINLLDQAREVVVGGERPADRWCQSQPPGRLGDFDLLSPIGRGGMGVVYEARQRSLDRIVALKVLQKSVLPDSEQEAGAEPVHQKNLVARFHIEARAAARLHHPNIVPVFGFGEAEGFYYFVMQRIYGQSLDRWAESNVHCEVGKSLHDSSLARTAARFGLEAANGLAYAHSEGVLHRDIKPANLLINEEMQLQIADFGVARIEDAEAFTRTSDVIGTLRYMSPEQLSGKSVPQSDVYSLGVTLYELVTGKPAIDDASARQAVLLLKRPQGPVPLGQLKPDLPLDFRTIIEKAMEPDLAQRYSDAKSMADDLDRFLGGRPIHARPLAWWERSGRWIRRNQTVAILAALLFVALTTIAMISVAGQLRLSRALDESRLAKGHAERTAGYATGALEKIFDRYAANSDSTSLFFEATQFSAPVVDPKTAALFEELIDYYDLLDSESEKQLENAQSSTLKKGRARLHLGVIHQQLGNHEAAIEAYKNALLKFSDDEHLLRARVNNQIGIVYETIGETNDAKQYHQKAQQVLVAQRDVDSDAWPSHAYRFEFARTRLLLARNLRPGMGPNSLPPASAFEGDCWGRSRGHLTGASPHRPGPPPPPRGLGRPEQRSHPGPMPHHARSSKATNVTSRQSGRLRREAFREVILDLAELHSEVPDSLAVTLLLSNAIRQSLGSVLHSFKRSDEDQWLLDRAEEIRSDLESKMRDERWAENDAAIAYELIQLLSDFSVFVDLRSPELHQGIKRLDSAMVLAEYLVNHYPNVPAYENLAVHVAYKAAALQAKELCRGPRPSSEEVRSVRLLLRKSLAWKQGMQQRATHTEGHSVWCALIWMRLGDLQFTAHDSLSAEKTYRRALRTLFNAKFRTLADLEADDDGQMPSNQPNSYLNVLPGLESILFRLAQVYETHDPACAIFAADLATQLSNENPPTASEISEQLSLLLDH